MLIGPSVPTTTCREVWTHFTYPGTFRGLVQSTAAWCTGRGWTFSWPTSFATNSTAAPAAKAADIIVQAEPQEQTDNWWVHFPVAVCRQLPPAAMEEEFC